MHMIIANVFRAAVSWGRRGAERGIIGGIIALTPRNKTAIA